MPSRRALRRYPLWYFNLIQTAQSALVVIHTVTPQLLRRDLYNFRVALREAAEQDPINEDLGVALQRAERLRFFVGPQVLRVASAGWPYSTIIEEVHYRVRDPNHRSNSDGNKANIPELD